MGKKRVKNPCAYCHRGATVNCDVDAGTPETQRCDRACCPRHSTVLPNGQVRCLRHESVDEQADVLPKT